VTEGGAGPAARECPRCQGTGFTRAVVGGREFARRCDCAPGASARTDPHRDPLHGLGVPARHRHCTLGNFVPRTPPLRAAYSRALAYCDRFRSGLSSEGLGLVFWGPPGTGKTHLAVAVLAELASNAGVGGRFLDFGAVLDEIARVHDRSALAAGSSGLEALLQAEVLVLDDLASRRMSDWAADALFTLVNGRYLARRPTVITTAYEDVDPETARDAHARRRQEFLVERVGQRLRSRLLEMCVFVPTGPSPERDGPRPAARPSTLGALRRTREGG